MKLAFGFTLVIIGIGFVFYVLYNNLGFAKETQVFSPYTLLTASWEAYKQEFITKEGRSIDDKNRDTTTSESQSYAMLRAVWLDDKATFDLVWKWTKENLKRPNSALFGWHWGKRKDNSYGFLPSGGDNSAADADSDIALALILAGNRWRNDSYLEESQAVLTDLWNTEVATASGGRYLIAGNWAQNDDYLIINPSYFAPYAWRLFAVIDPTHDWNELVTSGYALLRTITTDPLDKAKSANLPPNWIQLQRKTGEVTAPIDTHLDTTFGYDAVRVPWRIAMDWEWNKEELAKNYLFSLSYLTDIYKSQDKLSEGYSHDGTPISRLENPVMYASVLGVYLVTDPNMASKLYTEKIIRLYSNDSNSFVKNLPYYEQNWLWFAAALYHHQLPKYEK